MELFWSKNRSFFDRKFNLLKEKKEDKRLKIILLTDKGKEKLTQFHEEFIIINNVIEKDFSEEEKETLSKLLEKVNNNVSLNKE